MPFNLLKAKSFPLIVCFVHGFVNMSSWYFLPVYFQAVRGVSPTRSGILIMPIIVVQAVIGLAAGAVTYRFGWIRPLILVGMALTSLGFGQFINLDTSTFLAFKLLIEVVAALEVGTTFQAPLIAYQSVVGAADVAVAMALFAFVRSLSTSISMVVGGIVFQNGVSLQSDHLSRILGLHAASGAKNSLTWTIWIRTYGPAAVGVHRTKSL